MKHLLLMLAVIVIIIVVVYQSTPDGAIFDSLVDSSVFGPVMIASLAVIIWFAWHSA